MSCSTEQRVRPRLAHRAGGRRHRIRNATVSFHSGSSRNRNRTAAVVIGSGACGVCRPDICDRTHSGSIPTAGPAVVYGVRGPGWDARSRRWYGGPGGAAMPPGGRLSWGHAARSWPAPRYDGNGPGRWGVRGPGGRRWSAHGSTPARLLPQPRSKTHRTSPGCVAAIGPERIGIPTRDTRSGDADWWV